MCDLINLEPNERVFQYPPKTLPYLLSYYVIFGLLLESAEQVVATIVADDKYFALA